MTETPAFWYLWAAPDDARDPWASVVLALGPFSSQTDVDTSELPFRRWAENHVRGFHPWIRTGGVCYTTDHGPGRYSAAFKAYPQ